MYELFVGSDRQEILIHSDDAFAPVGYLKFLEMHLESKDVRFLSRLHCRSNGFGNTAYYSFFY